MVSDNPSQLVGAGVWPLLAIVVVEGLPDAGRLLWSLMLQLVFWAVLLPEGRLRQSWRRSFDDPLAQGVPFAAVALRPVTAWG